ncbi:MAG TPA: cyclase family protein [Bryobacteraceae bacterium]|nr:cyclase family protein [Bryobacteraceae bacterium]
MSITDPGRIPLGGVRLLDLSVAIEHEAPGEMTPPEIEYITHAASAAAVATVFGCRPEDLVYSGGQGWAVENVIAGSHTGTHIDAPYHYGATSEGKPARRIDEVPLEWFFGPGVVIDMRHKSDGELITVDDLRAALEQIRYTLQAGDIVLIHTGAARRWGTQRYFEQPGLGRESTLWLVEQGIHVIGIDAWTLDRSFASMAAEFRRTGDGRVLWAAHFAGLTREYCQIEKLANLELIPEPAGFYVSCLPVKIKGASAGWCRAVALLPR